MKRCANGWKLNTERQVQIPGCFYHSFSSYSSHSTKTQIKPIPHLDFFLFHLPIFINIFKIWAPPSKKNGYSDLIKIQKVSWKFLGLTKKPLEKKKVWSDFGKWVRKRTFQCPLCIFSFYNRMKYDNTVPWILWTTHLIFFVTSVVIT